ncbi:M48 family metallopeptidase [Carboxydocella sp. ULO1]|uniref:M48 family metallopeptidase n=1 Tax=Carboxydocella sp. ULO1 TaxID=1926599 RepID=UPI0013564F40|nr:SprT family zinc-dependent metalloprotease [Carboxydocella sp. ULO1]
MQITTTKIIRSARKTVVIEITPDGCIIIRAPKRLSMKAIEELVHGKDKWIRDKLQEIQRQQKLFQPLRFETGDKLWFLGEKYTFTVTDGSGMIYLQGDKLYFPREQLERGTEQLSRWYKKEVERILLARTEYFSGLTGIKYNSVKITSARKRWGSCSSKGVLSFSWRLLQAPLQVIDYVVVHELLHIEHMNHSRQFWARVKQIIPDYRGKRDWLRENQMLLQLL